MVVQAASAEAFDLARVDYVADQYLGSVVSAAVLVLAEPPKRKKSELKKMYVQ